MIVAPAAIADYIAKTNRIDRIKLEPATALFSSGLLDSFAMVDLVSFIEKSAGIRFRAKELTLENFDSIDGMTAFLSRRAT